MSFFGGAECSTGRNPLAALSKLGSTDSTHQQTRLVAGRPAAADAGLRTIGEMGQVDQQVRTSFPIPLLVFLHNTAFLSVFTQYLRSPIFSQKKALVSD